MAILNNNPLVGASGNQGGYNINNSLRFRASASAYLSRTPASTTNRQTWTWSSWVKRGAFNAAVQNFFRTNPTVITALRFTSTDTIEFFTYTTSFTSQLVTTQVFRDPSAWYHIVLAVDTTQATAANRIKLYVNGQQVTVFSTSSYPSQNYNTGMNENSLTFIGANTSGSEPFDGYMADINFIDGSAKTPSDFGETDTTTGVWKPKAYTGTYGTNGFYLKFSDIATTSGSNAGLGKDFSGNSNYWTTNNISVTAGTTYDAMTDSPTLTSATVANYPVYDQLIPANVSGSGVRSISAANLYVTNSGPNGWSAIGTTMVMTSGSGKWYWEVTCSGTTSNGTMIGIHRPFTSTSTFPSAIIGYDTPPDPDGYGYYMGGNKYNNSGAGVAYGASYTAGDVIGVALDMSTAGSASITFYKNNTSQGVAFSSLTGDFFAAVSQAQANGLDINFGQRPFSYTPPTGYVALNTFNLPTSTIVKGNSYFDSTLYTGTGSSQSIVNAGGFSPDFVWVKNRSHNDADPYYGVHLLFNTNAGVGNRLMSQSTASEAFSSQSLTAFNSNGFSIGTDNAINYSGDAYVSWQWRGSDNSAVTNTSGTITSTVSANTTAGFSIATFTGTGANATIGHGLGIAPRMFIVKTRSGAADWVVYHASVGNTAGLYLNQTAASTTSSAFFNNTSPTSSVFTLGNGVVGNGVTAVAYCWAEIAGFSRFGSYTGNGSTDGPFVFTNFRPKYVMIKGNAVVNWWILDTSRNTYNVANEGLLANSSAATNATINPVDFVSNGFKLRDSNGEINANGTTYLYACFAESPFKNSLAR